MREGDEGGYDEGRLRMIYTFMAMYSGGWAATPWSVLYFDAESEESAIEKFAALADLDPSHVSCECCGPDFVITASDDIAQATAFDRGCRAENGRYVEEPLGGYRSYVRLEDYLSREGIYYEGPRSKT